MKPTPEDAKRVFDYAYATATGCWCWPVSEQMACRLCRMRPVCIAVRDAIADAPKPPCPRCNDTGRVPCPHDDTCGKGVQCQMQTVEEESGVCMVPGDCGAKEKP